MNKFFGIALVVIAVALAVVPVFTDCQSQGKVLTLVSGKEVPMKCHWTGIAEIGVAIPLLVVGGLMVANRRKENVRNLGIIGIMLGSMAIAFPGGLIGVCQTPTMICHTVLKPVEMTLGSLAILGSLGAMILTRKGQD